jgi:Uncharacterised nucleotidyltransferase
MELATVHTSQLRRIEALVERLELPQVQAHGLGPLAAVCWRAIGREVPVALLEEERAARLIGRMAPIVLTAARAGCSGPMLLLKGAELAARYPARARRYSDIDLLVPDADAAQRELLSAGFEEAPGVDAVAPHHLRPLVMPGLPVKVELHCHPKWPSVLTLPRSDALFDSAVASVLGIEGLDAPAPHHHALLIATHAWAHAALRSARDLIDTVVMAAAADDRAIESTAESWGISRLWRTTQTAAEWLLGYRQRPSLAVRVWAPHLRTLREATFAEAYRERWLSDFWVLPFREALVESARIAVADVLPSAGESWRDKSRRIMAGVRDARMPRSARGWKAE